MPSTSSLFSLHDALNFFIVHFKYYGPFNFSIFYLLWIFRLITYKYLRFVLDSGLCSISFSLAQRNHVHIFVQACKLKLGDLTGALLDANDAIYDGEDNIKAFYRQGQVGVLSYKM